MVLSTTNNVERIPRIRKVEIEACYRSLTSGELNERFMVVNSAPLQKGIS